MAHTSTNTRFTAGTENRKNRLYDNGVLLTLAEVSAYYGEHVPGLKQTAAGEWRGPCPIHNGQRDSFAVKASTGQWHCHSECDRGGDVFDLETELSGGTFPERKARVFAVIGREESVWVKGTQPTSPDTFRVKAEYIYRDEHGATLYRVQRKERGNGAGREKTFPQAHWKNGTWQSGVKGVRKVPYRYPEFLAAEPGTMVFLPEGEKDVDRLVQLGLTATCNSEGADRTHFYSLWLDRFRGGRYVIPFDNDLKGRKHAADKAEILLPVAASIKVLDLPGLAEKGDISDWLDAGGSVKELLRLADAAEVIDAEKLAALREKWGLVAVAEPVAKQPVHKAGPYRLQDDGVYWMKPDGEGGVDPVRISDRLEIVAKTRSANSEDWGRLLRWNDADGKAHEWAMPAEALAGDTVGVRARLMSGGLGIPTNRGHREKFADYLQTYPVAATVHCVDRIGWHGKSFILPGFIAGDAGVVYQPIGEAVHSWATAGTAAEWSEHVGRLCVGNSRLLLAVSVPFAGPLITLAGAESGGFHIVGTTSSGKTTTLVVGASVCGGGLGAGFVRTWRSTANGFEATAAAHNDSALFLDELGQLDPKEAAEVAYMLANGQGKTRMGKSLAVRASFTWQLLFLSSGETTLEEHAAVAGRRVKAGVSVRCLNLPADAGCGLGLFEELHGHESAATFADAVKTAARQYYGAAFQAYLNKLTAERAAARAAISCETAGMRTLLPPEATGEVRRAADRFGLVAAGGELATRWGLTGWPEGAARAAAERCLRDWLHERGTVGGADAEAGVRAVRGFIEQHGASRFQHVDDRDSRTVNRAGFWRVYDGQKQWLFLPESFEKEVCRGFNAKAVAEALRERGHLVHEPDRLKIKPRIKAFYAEDPVDGKTVTTWVYCVRETIMHDGESGAD